MIGKQNRDALYFCCIFEDSSVSHIVYKKTQLGGGGVGGGGKGWVERDQFKSIQVRTAGGRAMECEYIRSLTTFLLFFFCFLFFFLLGSMQILQTLKSKNIYKQISRAVSLLYTSASFYHFLSKQFGVMRKLQFHTTSNDGNASSKF